MKPNIFADLFLIKIEFLMILSIPIFLMMALLISDWFGRLTRKKET